MKPISSAITGLPSRAPQAANSTGAAHGETGSVTISTGAPSREMHPEVMARMPSANTGAVLSRILQCGVECSVKTETVFPTSADGDMTFRERPTSLTLNIGSSADVQGALRIVLASLAPASADQIEEWLAVLSVKTAPRVESASRADLTLSVYTDQLSQYPADVVRHVLAGWSGKWWPTWGELSERLDELTDQRLMIRDRLLDVLNGREPKQVAHDPIAEKLAKLRGDLEAAERVAAKYPDLAESTERKAQAIADEIAQLEGTN